MHITVLVDSSAGIRTVSVDSITVCVLFLRFDNPRVQQGANLKTMLSVLISLKCDRKKAASIFLSLSRHINTFSIAPC